MADKDLDELTKSFKAAADAAGKFERAQKSLQETAAKTADMLARLGGSTTSGASDMKELEKRVNDLLNSVNPLQGKLKEVKSALDGANELQKLGKLTTEQHAAAVRELTARQDAAFKSEEALTKARRFGADAARLQSGEARKLGKSIFETVGDLRKGADPIDILIKQGPALWEVFSNAASSGIGFKGVLAGVAAEYAPLIEGLGPLGTAVTGALGSIGPGLLAVGGIAAVAAGGVAIAAQQIGKSVGENLDHLHLTEEQLEKVKNKGVTMGDVLSAAWKGVADMLVGVFGPSLAAVGGFFADLYQGAIDGVMGFVKAAFQGVGGFVGGVKTSFAGLPAAIGDLIYSTVNATAGGLEMLANTAIGIVNKLTQMANVTAAKLGIPIQLPELSTISISRLENKYAGAAAALGNAMVKGATEGAANGGRAYDQMASNVIKSVAAARDRRVVKEAGPRPKTATGGENIVNDNDVNDVTNTTINNIDNRASRSSRTQTECACKDAEASVQVQNFTSAENLQMVQGELEKVQVLEEAVISAIPQPEAITPFKDELGEIVGHFERLSALAPDLGKNFEAAFGGSGKAITGVIVAASNMGKALTQIAQQQEKAEGGDAIKFTRARVNASVSGFAEMSIAAKDFFDKNSSGYAALQSIEKAYRAWQFAQQAQAMAQEIRNTVQSISGSMAKGAASTAAGAAKMFEVLGPFAFPAVAAMVALLAGFGLSGGVGGAVAGVDDMKNRQEKQGSSSVLGDSKAKSDSLEKALTHAQAYENKDLEYGNAMVRSLRSIDDQIGAVASALAKSFGAGGMLSTEGLNLGKTGTSASLSNFGFSKSTTRTLQDQGIQFSAASLGDIANGLLGGSTYQQVLETTTKKAFFLKSSSKSRVITETGSLDADFLGQVTELIKSMGKGVSDAAKALGETGVEAALASFTVDLGKLSFKDMTGTQIEEALSAIFGKLGDDMAKAALPAIAQFQKVGEGAFETLVRVARQYEVIDTTLKSVGMKFVEVGAASLEARERLVDLVGGLDNLTDQTAFFAEHFLTEGERLKPVQDRVSERLTELKLPGDLSRDDFKKLVLGQNVATKEGAELYAALMDLAPAFDKVATAAESAKTAAGDKQTSIQDQIDELTMSSAQKLAKAHDAERKAAVALDEALGPLLDTLWGLQHAAEVDEKRKSIQDQIDDLTLSSAQLLAKSRTAEMEAVKALDATLVPLVENLWKLQDAAAAAKLQTDRSNMLASLMEAQGRTEEAKRLRRNLALAQIEDPVQKLYQQQIWAAEDAAEKVSAARDVLTQAYQREQEAIQATKDKFKELSTSLRAFSTSLTDTIAGTDPAARYRRSRETFLSTAALARLGDADAMGRLQNEGEAFTAASRDYVSTSLDYLRDVGLVRSAVDEAADTADRQVSIAQRQLDALDASVQGLIEIKASVVSVEQAILSLRGALGEARSAGVVSVGGSSLGLVDPALAGSGGTGVPMGLTQAQKDYNNAAWNWGLVNSEAGKAGADMTDPVMQSIYASAAKYNPGYMDIVNTQGIEAANALVAAGKLSFTQTGSLKFATGGAFEVGGSGPPDSKLFSLALSPGEAVNVRRRDTPADQPLIDELRNLRAELADLRASNARIATSNDKMERTLTNVTEGGRAMQTQAAA